MRSPSFISRLSAATAVAGLFLVVPGLPPAVLAQPAPPAMAPGQQVENPPDRVGWLQRINGGVSFHTADQDQWTPAVANYPVASGASLWTEPNGTAQVAVSASVIGMAGGTELDVATLDPNGLQSTLPQGEIYLGLRDLAPSEAWSVQTPRGLVTFTGAGRYDVAAGDTQDPTTVTVLDGAAQISGPGFSLRVAPGQTATITGTDTFQGSIGSAQTDTFLADWERQPPPASPVSAAVPAVVAQMPGGDDLSAYGSWTQTADYGDVWYPQVASGWAPYQEGYWSDVQPWGWTWIDSAPWGFAPFHYGRWVQVGGRWGWTPGVVAVSGPPVYAPALVAFFGVGAAVGAGTIGWFPLGPQEPYHPWFHAPQSYLLAVNRRDVRNLASIGRPLPMDSYLNRAAVSAMPAAAMAESRLVHQAGVRVDPQMLAAARPVIGTPPIRPTVATVGMTPDLARRMHLAAPAAGTPAATHVAPGPAIHAMPMAHGVAAHSPLPALVPHQGSASQQGAVRPDTARPVGVAGPELRSPAAREGGPPAIEHAAPGAGPLTARPAPGAPSAGAAVAGGALERHEPVPAGVQRPGAGSPAFDHGAPGPTQPPVNQVQRAEEHSGAVPNPPEHGAAPPRPTEAHEVPHPAAPVAHAPEVRPGPAAEHAPRPEEHASLPAPHAPAPPPQFHAAPAPAREPAFHAPPPEVHAAPRPQEHAAPPPQEHAAPRPQEHAAAAPHPAPAEHDKRPNER